jgi:hypothetical protein
MRTQDVHALGDGAATDSEQRHRLLHAKAVNLIPGGELFARGDGGFKRDVARGFGLAHNLGSTFALGFAKAQKISVQRGGVFQLAHFLFIIIFEAIFSFHSYILLIFGFSAGYFAKNYQETYYIIMQLGNIYNKLPGFWLGNLRKFIEICGKIHKRICAALENPVNICYY